MMNEALSGYEDISQSFLFIVRSKKIEQCVRAGEAMISYLLRA